MEVQSFILIPVFLFKYFISIIVRFVRYVLYL